MSKPILLPDTGNNNPVDIIEIHVAAGDEVTEGQTLLTLESDKATIEVPSPEAGRIQSLKVKVGDKVKTGDVIVEMEGKATADTKPVKAESPSTKTAPALEKTPVPASQSTTPTSDTGVRRLCRVLGVDLTQIKGTGAKDRITQEDVEAYVKNKLAHGGTSGGMGLPTMPVIDFTAFGETEKVALTRIKKLTAQNLSRNWLLAPHVTQFDSADITDLETFRKKESPAVEKQGFKLTPLVFIMKAVVKALAKFPQFNASLDETGENLIYKKYFHLGIAVDTPEGLVVPVIRDVDKKSLIELAKELAEISLKAREKKLTAQDMQGSCFTISSLGGIGGTAFTPIINLPNVAILGVSKASIEAKYNGEHFVPRLMLPLSLSYDHRVIDGAEAARFCVSLADSLSNIGKLLL